MQYAFHRQPLHPYNLPKRIITVYTNDTDTNIICTRTYEGSKATSISWFEKGVTVVLVTPLIPLAQMIRMNCFHEIPQPELPLAWLVVILYSPCSERLVRFLLESSHLPRNPVTLFTTTHKVESSKFSRPRITKCKFPHLIFMTSHPMF